MQATLCVNEEKAKQRALVMKAFSVWLDGLQNFVKTKKGMKYTAEVGTVYSLPATLWDFESFIAAKSLQMGFVDQVMAELGDGRTGDSNAKAKREFERDVQLNLSQRDDLSADQKKSYQDAIERAGVGVGRINLHCFENQDSIYCAQTGTRVFMRSDNELYPNFNGEYHFCDIPSNQHVKNNFAAWYDFTGNPSQFKLDVVTDRKNFVRNSLVFVTFDACVIAKSCLPQEITNFIQNGMNKKEGTIQADFITDAVVDYIDKHTNNKVKCIVSVEYQAQRHPMMMIGFSNSAHVLKACAPIHTRIHRSQKVNINRTLNRAQKVQLIADLKSFSFTRNELCDKYKCTPHQVGATIKWYGGGYVAS